MNSINSDINSDINSEQPLKNKIALVTGASRGIGKGIALALTKAGAKTYITARSLKSAKTTVPLGGSLQEVVKATKNKATKNKAIAIQCDHSNDASVIELFDKIKSESGRLDILVNNAWAGYQMLQQNKTGFSTKFWKHNNPPEFWDAMFDVGVRSHYIASSYAAELMTKQTSGLIVQLTSKASFKYTSNVAYGVSKAAVSRMAEDMAHELKKYQVAVVALCPGTTKTEMILSRKGSTDYNESPEFVGRSIVALACDPTLMTKSGQTLITRDLALSYGFTDIDGKQPSTKKGF